MKLPPAIATILATLFEGLAMAFGAVSKGAAWAAERLRESAQS